MKSKHLPLIALTTIVIIIVSVLVFKPSGFNFELNVKKYHTENIDGKEFIFYGSFGNVGSLTVKENGKKIAKLDVNADADIYGGDFSAVEICDVNADGENDLLIAVAVDEDGDVHSSLFLASDGKYTHIQEVDAVNFTLENGKIISEEKLFKYLAQPVEAYTVPYENSVCRTIYEYYNGTVIASTKTIVTYYSESDIYCLGLWMYDPESEDMLPVSEDWISPQEYSRIYEELDEIFASELP